MKKSSVIDNNPIVLDFKRKSKVLFKKIKESVNKDITLRACQDLVAQQSGYKHWHEFHTQIKRKYEENSKEVKEIFFKKIPQNYIDYGYSNELGLHLGLKSLNDNTLIIGENRKNINIKLVKQSILNNEHVIYMDGECENINEIEDFAISAGRQKDIKIISFLPEKDNFKYTTIPRNLPFMSDVLSELIISIIIENEDDDIIPWKAQLHLFAYAIIKALVHMRDNNNLVLDFNSIYEHIHFNKVVKLSKDVDNLPQNIITLLEQYLFLLPQYNPNIIEQSESCMETHGYLEMQFNKMFAFITNDYSHLFSKNPDLQYSDLIGSNKNLIIIIKFPKFSNSKYYMYFLSEFMMKIIKTNIFSNKVSSTKIKWFINNCPLYKDFNLLLSRSKDLNISFVLSYLDNKLLENEKQKNIELLCNVKILMNSEKTYSFNFREVKHELML